MTSYPRATMGGGLGGEADAARRLRFSGYLWRRDATRRRAQRTRPGRFRGGPRLSRHVRLARLGCVWMVPPPAGLVLAGTGYETNLALPPNVFGKATLRQLADLTRRPASWRFWGTRHLASPTVPGSSAAPPTFGPGKSGWPIDQSRRSSCTSPCMEPLIARNRPCLLVDDVGSGHGFIPLSDVLTRLKAGPLAAKKRLLLLDATGLDSAWHLGILSNDFALALEELNRQIADDPNLIVVSASSPGERSWPAPASGTTAFGRFVVAGLGGAAEVATTVDPLSGEVRKAERLTALDFFRYVRAEVGRWAPRHSTRGRPNSPDVPAWADRRSARGHVGDHRPDWNHSPRKHPAPLPPPASAELRAAWGSYQRLLRDDPHPAAYAPQLWTLYQATVLHGDELERSGDPASARVLFERLTSLRRRIDEATVCRSDRPRARRSACRPWKGTGRFPPETAGRCRVESLVAAGGNRPRRCLAACSAKSARCRDAPPPRSFISKRCSASKTTPAQESWSRRRPHPRTGRPVAASHRRRSMTCSWIANVRLPAGRAGAIDDALTPHRARPQTCRGSRARNQSSRALSL